ncbi:MAG: hypothetical protein AVDCRST_MAG88-1226, partial [uncultured Thermomicrobiales bacterium]
PLALYVLITVVVTWPLALHFGTHVPGDGGDALQNVWNYWWTREAILGGRNPFWTPLLYAPGGAPLYLHTLNLFNGLVSLPVQLLFGLIPAYNTVVFLSFGLAAYFAYLLTAHVSGCRFAGFFGGVVYAFGSYHLAHLLGHMNLLASEWLPAYALCLIAATGARGRRRTLLAAAGVGALLLVTLVDWQYVLFALIFTALYAPLAAVVRRSVAPLVVAAAIGVVWGVAALPLLAPTIAEVRSGIAASPNPVFAGQYSAEPRSFVARGPLQSWREPWRAPVGRAEKVVLIERTLFLGWLPLGLAAAALWRCRRRAVPWAALALPFVLLALGPSLRLGEWA